SLLDNDGKLKDSVQGRMRDFKEARLNLGEGVRLLGVNRAGAVTRLQAAVKKYEELLQTAGRVPLLQQEALWGAAKGNEALGELDKAKEWYTKLANEYKTGLGADAKKQLERLEGSSDLRELVKEFAPEATGRRN
ncbi:MAG: tetratricopeptide repeat protein, partial [Gemmataceae bacterium]